MPAAAYDTQHGATIALTTDSLALRVVSIGATRGTKAMVITTHHGTATNESKTVGDLYKFGPVTVRYQNSPALGNPTQVHQTITITGPVPPGGSTGEIIAGTGVVNVIDVGPAYEAGTDSLQMKEATIEWDGLTGPTRTAAA